MDWTFRVLVKRFRESATAENKWFYIAQVADYMDDDAPANAH
jgi:hypothetical protein